MLLLYILQGKGKYWWVYTTRNIIIMIIIVIFRHHFTMVDSASQESKTLMIYRVRQMKTKRVNMFFEAAVLCVFCN